MAMEGTGVSMSRNSKLMTYTSSKSAFISNTQKADIQTNEQKPAKFALIFYLKATYLR